MRFHKKPGGMPGFLCLDADRLLVFCEKIAGSNPTVLNVKAWIMAVLAACFVSGCATQVDPQRIAAPGPAITFQSNALRPANGETVIGADALLPGDILLSTGSGLTSAGIRLITTAPVSHAALYLGDGDVAEAVGSGVRLRKIGTMIDDEAVIVAFRHPDFQSGQGGPMRDFADRSIGRRYDYVGVMLHAPFSLQRRICELPLLPASARADCLRGIATIQLGSSSDERFFCSQFVLEAYKSIGLPMTDADPRWISPADILHMREGDVPSQRANQTLVYIGHLKFRPEPVLPVRPIMLGNTAGF
ncbi:distant relative of cell wall-associated hydrolase [Jeongeupia wiesaeckerbachi]|uniref:distant relative of cell wall-associated hydrolase n=1 Tax=Jeongeupia wiesaeckerbachi TaxID=3051218 RepID=UPI003D803771